MDRKIIIIPTYNEKENIEKIINIALESGADAIHPGYGFLAENAEFVRKCEENGITIVPGLT